MTTATHSPGEQLTARGYSLVSVLNHNELTAFIVPWVYKKNRLTIGFLILNIIFLLLMTGSFVRYVMLPSGTFGTAFAHFGYGCAVPFLLIPVHELLHGFAYKWCGASKVSYQANWRKMYFMALADQFVVNRKQFFVVGSTPFVVISLALLTSAIFSSFNWQITWLTALLVHSSMCVGDLGLMSYFESNKDQGIVTFDDVNNGVTYFYSLPTINSGS